MWVKWLVELVMDIVADVLANLFTNGKSIKDVKKWFKRKM